MNIFQKRRIRQRARELMHHVRHVRNMREDIVPGDLLQELDTTVTALNHHYLERNYEKIPGAMDHLIRTLNRIIPARPMAVVRENVEVIVVAVVVAMAFRSYFIQPFKIPTGSMETTLYGIHYEQCDNPGIFDSLPLKTLKWLVRGTWYTEFVAKANGPIQGPLGYDPDNSAYYRYTIAGIPHNIPHELRLNVKHGDLVYHGQILAAGIRLTGDHIFVDKVRWYLRSPRRDDVMVFKTDGIPLIGRTKTHYIKRMVGIPNDDFSIEPPNLVINGKVTDHYFGINRVQRKIPKNGVGYLLPGIGRDLPEPYLAYQGQVRHLGQGQYLAFGDNTRSSFDSRFWGPVPEKNLVGPAFMVYWPFTERWGLIR